MGLGIGGRKVLDHHIQGATVYICLKTLPVAILVNEPVAATSASQRTHQQYVTSTSILAFLAGDESALFVSSDMSAPIVQGHARKFPAKAVSSPHNRSCKNTEQRQ